MGLREKHKDQRRRAIIDAASTLLRERGLEGLSIPDIAARADVAPATVYNLIGGQNAVAAAILSDAIADPDLTSLPPESRDPLLAIVQHVGDLLTLFDERERDIRPILLLYLTRRGSPEWNAEKPMLFMSERAVHRYQALIATAQADGTFDGALEARSVAATLFAAIKTRIDAWAVGLMTGAAARQAARCDAAIVLLSGATGDVRLALLDIGNAPATPA
jgi:AcrR family transcriptional regulator